MKFIGYALIIFCALFALDFITYKFFGSHLVSLNPVISQSLIGPKKLWCNLQGKDFIFQQRPFGVYESCVTRVSDGGDSCESGTACQSGKCFVGIDTDSSRKEGLVGRCGNTGEVNYCQFAEIEKGKIVLDLRGAICD